MKFYSEDLKKFFDTADECQKAEDKAKAERTAVAAKEAKLKAEKEARLKELSKAMEKAEKLLKAYVKDYGDHSSPVDNLLVSYYHNCYLPF